MGEDRRRSRKARRSRQKDQERMGGQELAGKRSTSQAVGQMEEKEERLREEEMALEFSMHV